MASPARAADANAIQAIDVAEQGGAVELAIRGSRPPSYTVFKLQDPPRLVVDLAGADVTGVASPVQVGKGGVLSVSTAQYKDERSTVGRVIVALDGARRYEVQERGDAVVVRVLSPEAPASGLAGRRRPRRPRPPNSRTPDTPALAHGPAAAPATAAPPPAAEPTPRRSPATPARRARQRQRGRPPHRRGPGEARRQRRHRREAGRARGCCSPPTATSAPSRSSS